jgi:hypothetical protein
MFNEAVAGVEAQARARETIRLAFKEHKKRGLKPNEVIPYSLALKRLVDKAGEDGFDPDRPVENCAPSPRGGPFLKRLTMLPTTPAAISATIQSGVPSKPFLPSENPHVFLAVDHPFYYAAYATLLRAMGCKVSGCRNLLRAPFIIAPKERLPSNPNPYNLVIYEKRFPTSPDTSVVDFVHMVRGADAQYQRSSNFLARNTIVHLIGENEVGSVSMVTGADLFLRRPFACHLQTIRDILLPRLLRSGKRCRILNKGSGYHRLLEMIEEQEDALESKITFEEVAPKLPILADHLNDSEEMSYLRRTIELQNKELAKLRHSDKDHKERLEVEERRRAEAEARIGEMELQHKAEVEELNRQLSQVTSANHSLGQKVDRLEASERTRVATVRDSKELLEANQSLAKAQTRINHLVAELEKERRMNAHQRAGLRANVKGQNTSDAFTQAGSGVVVMYNNKKDGVVQCELLTMEMLNRARHAHQEANRVIEDLLKSDEKQAVERRMSMNSRRMSMVPPPGATPSSTPLPGQSLPLSRRMSGSASVSSDHLEPAATTALGRAQGYLQTAEIQSLQLKLSNTEKSLELARTRVSQLNAELLQRQVEIASLKFEKNDLYQILDSVRDEAQRKGDITGASDALTQRLTAALRERDALNSERKEALEKSTVLAEELENQRTSVDALKLRNRMYRAALAVIKLRAEQKTEHDATNPFRTPHESSIVVVQPETPPQPTVPAPSILRVDPIQGPTSDPSSNGLSGVPMLSSSSTTTLWPSLNQLGFEGKLQPTGGDLSGSISRPTSGSLIPAAGDSGSLLPVVKESISSSGTVSGAATHRSLSSTMLTPVPDPALDAIPDFELTVGSRTLNEAGVDALLTSLMEHEVRDRVERLHRLLTSAATSTGAASPPPNATGTVEPAFTPGERVGSSESWNATLHGMDNVMKRLEAYLAQQHKLSSIASVSPTASSIKQVESATPMQTSANASSSAAQQRSKTIPTGPSNTADPQPAAEKSQPLGPIPVQRPMPFGK